MALSLSPDALIWQKRIAAASTFFCYLQWDELPLEVFQLYSRENDCPPKENLVGLKVYLHVHVCVIVIVTPSAMFMF